MANQVLKGKKVAILATNGVEQVELTDPKKALESAGATVHVVSPTEGKIKAWQHGKWGDEISVDVPLENAKPNDYYALVLPGGVMNPDKLRLNPKAVNFVRSFFSAEKPVAAICHGPWLVIEAGAAEERTLTSWPSLQTDIRNAGGEWVDEEVVEDKGLITSRGPADIPAFNEALIRLLGDTKEARD